MTFGQKLKSARKNKRYTQKKLAEAIGAKHNSVSDWENDKNKPDPDTIELICGVLDISASYLLGTGDPKDLLSPEAINIARAYDKADFDKQNIVRLTLGLNLKNKPDIPGQVRLPITEADFMISSAENPKEYLLPNAAHAIEGATEEDNKYDDDIMDSEDF